MRSKKLDRALVERAIGYDMVPLSIREHPEIRWEYRTIADRDGLVDRIAPLLAAERSSAFIDGVIAGRLANSLDSALAQNPDAE